MSNNEKPYWFAAKTFGWGWTLPVAWQGWLVVVVYAALIIGSLIVSAQTRPFWTFAA